MKLTMEERLYEDTLDILGASTPGTAVRYYDPVCRPDTAVDFAAQQAGV